MRRASRRSGPVRLRSRIALNGRIVTNEDALAHIVPSRVVDLEIRPHARQVGYDVDLPVVRDELPGVSSLKITVPAIRERAS